MDDDGYANGVQDVTRSDVWINGGFFVLRKEVLDHIGPGEDLVNEPFARLMRDRQVLAQRHDGFWAPMDTLKDKQSLEQLHDTGTAPWQVWDLSRRMNDDVALAAVG
jgi:glucose-1-phosphate cytidylyltransferase